MNLEKFHAVISDLMNDRGFTNVARQMVNLRESLQNKINQPQQKQHQEGIAQALGNLNELLGAATSNDYPPTWQQIMDDLELSDITGNDLQLDIAEIFERNQITDAIALQEISELTSKVEQSFKNVEKISQGLDWFGVGTEELEAGEAQLALLVPRSEVKNALGQFAKELERINHLLGVYSEIATGKRDKLTIKAISSSDFGVFLDLAPQIAAQLSTVVEKLVQAYKAFVELREIRTRLSKIDVPDNSLTDLDQYINDKMSDEIRKIAKDTIKEHEDSIEAGRAKELEIELRFSMNGIANRLDRGFSFEVTAKPLAEPEDGEISPEDEQLSADLQKVIDSSESTKFLRLEGSPILSLPDKVDEPKD